jgi:hypothetical protein
MDPCALLYTIKPSGIRILAVRISSGVLPTAWPASDTPTAVQLLLSARRLSRRAEARVQRQAITNENMAVSKSSMKLTVRPLRPICGPHARTCSAGTAPAMAAGACIGESGAPILSGHPRKTGPHFEPHRFAVPPGRSDRYTLVAIDLFAGRSLCAKKAL